LPRENCSAFANAVAFALRSSPLAAVLYENGLYFTSLFLMPDDRSERIRKGSSKNRNAMWKTYYWLKILQASKLKTKKQFQGYCQFSL